MLRVSLKHRSSMPWKFREQAKRAMDSINTLMAPKVHPAIKLLTSNEDEAKTTTIPKELITIMPATPRRAVMRVTSIQIPMHNIRPINNSPKRGWTISQPPLIQQAPLIQQVPILQAPPTPQIQASAFSPPPLPKSVIRQTPPPLSTSAFRNFDATPMIIPKPPKVASKAKSSEMPFPIIDIFPTAGRVIAIDVESTGLGKKHKITEIACIEMVDGKITGNIFHSRVNPEREVSEDAYRLTGHTRESLKKCPRFADIATNFITFIKGAILVFHGAENDIKWINDSIHASGIDYDISIHIIKDTYVFMKQLNPIASNSLDAVCKRYNIEGRENGRHTALVDARMLAEVYCAANPSAWFMLAEELTDNHYFKTVHALSSSTFRCYRERTSDGSQEIITTLIAFRNMIGDIIGVYAKSASKKRFFGDIRGFADICPGNQSTIILGDISSTLQARDLMWGEDAAIVHKSLNINGFSIKAYAHPKALSDLQLHKSTTLIIIFDFDPGAARKYLLNLFENKGKASLKIVLTSTKSLLDRVCGAVQIKCVEDLQRLWPLEKLDTLLEGIEWARELYASASKKPSSAALLYLKRRSIKQEFPSSFRFTELRHNWSQEVLPVILVPLFKDNAVVGLHRIFCHHDGSSLAEEYKRQRKVSIGDAVGVEVNIYQGNINDNNDDKDRPTVVLISEGIENSLVIRDVMIETAKKVPHRAKTMYDKLGITKAFAIKSCVGVNGLMGIPFPPETHTVVIVADNDGDNIDVKRTLRETVLRFLDKKLIVRVAMPETTDGSKTDLNDIYVKNGRNSRNVVDVLCNSVRINNIEEFGEDNESLQKVLTRLRTR